MMASLIKNTLIRSHGKRELHRAGFIVIDAERIIENGYIECCGGRIRKIHSVPPNEPCCDHGPGVLLPPLVNAHVHLELSALKNSLSYEEGFRDWIRQLLKKRDSLDTGTLILAADTAAKELICTGHGYSGEISTLGITRSVMADNSLHGICFHEILGSNKSQLHIEKNEQLSFSVAGHGPHTTSPAILYELKKRSKSKNLPFSIHAAESDDEMEFILGKKGDWADFLTERGIDYSNWEIGAKSPVKYLNEMNILDNRTVLVHALNVSDDDMNIISDAKAKLCVCPRSNFNLHRKLPDIETFLSKGISPALGTDSFASCDSINIWDEMKFIADHYPSLAPEHVFSMATINGAVALGIHQRAGTLDQGKAACFVYKDLMNIQKKALIEMAIHYA